MDSVEYNWLDNIADWILLISTAVALVVSIIHRRKKFIFSLQIYIVASFVLAVYLKSFDFIKVKDVRKFTTPVMLIYSLIEISTILCFYYRELKRIRIRILLTFLYLIYLLFFILGTQKYGLHQLVYSIESILITIASLCYIVNVLNRDEIIDRYRDPSFISACGIFFYFCFSSPYFPLLMLIGTKYKNVINMFTFLNNTSNAIVFVAFILAFLCPQNQETKQFAAGNI